MSTAADAFRARLSADALTVAPMLLGARLASTFPAGRVVVRVTEVEAYQGATDPGSHAYHGPTRRNCVMFGPAGHAYVYFTYGMHHCINVVTGAAGVASAVLVRSGEVVEGVPIAMARRPAARTPRDLARGPARLASALGIELTDNGADLLSAESPLRLILADRPVPTELVCRGPRVGVAGPGGDGERYPWRLWLAGDATVSRYRPATPRRPRRIVAADVSKQAH